MAIQFNCGNRGLLLVDVETAEAVQCALAQHFNTPADRVKVAAPYLTAQAGQATGPHWEATVYPPPDALAGPPIHVSGIHVDLVDGVKCKLCAEWSHADNWDEETRADPENETTVPIRDGAGTSFMEGGLFYTCPLCKKRVPCDYLRVVPVYPTKFD